MTESRDQVLPHLPYPPGALTAEETDLLLARNNPAHLATLDAAGFPHSTLPSDEQGALSAP